MVKIRLYRQRPECDLIEVLFLIEDLVVDRFVNVVVVCGISEIFIQIGCRYGMNWRIFGVIRKTELLFILNLLTRKQKYR